MEWLVKDTGFNSEDIAKNGNKFLLGNGYMGLRGTLEEYSAEQKAACTLAGVYDQAGDRWRELVNAPNGILTRLYCDGEPLSVLSAEVMQHEQALDIRNALHRRSTEFAAKSGKKLHIRAERFLSLSDLHLIGMKYSFTPSRDCRVVIETGIDGDVWDINGPHLKNVVPQVEDGILLMKALTGELGCPVIVTEGIDIGFGDAEVVRGDKLILRRIVLDARGGMEYSFVKFISVYSGRDGPGDLSAAALHSCRAALEQGYKEAFARHAGLWNEKWEQCDVQVLGDAYAQLALRYSIYHLLILAPGHSERLSIPARGLSGQVYKGAVFWDTEMFMLPFYLLTSPEVARNIVRYRCHTLDGARRKAREYGYRGAFYAWESQDTGDDACTHFNVTDVFTGRPMRTYFRDKQVHISADVVYGIWQYYLLTGDESILLEGGAEVVLECARFFFSYAYYSKERNRYEILDVTGPDEYHERVNNNAYTNLMVKYALEVAVEIAGILEKDHRDAWRELVCRLDYERDLGYIREMKELLYIPQPDPRSLVIEQFDRYHTLEDMSLEELKARILHPNEYLGGGNGLALTTKVLKQADTVLMLNLLKDRYSHEVKKANWEYYEPRTEHGSSLSACVYAMLACDTGSPDWGYGYFMKTASIDLTGESKQYVGTLYIGGTHPAANGGAWMTAVAGFGGVSAGSGGICINPQLPSAWEALAFNIIWRDQKLGIRLSKEKAVVKSDAANTQACAINCRGKSYSCGAGQEIVIEDIVCEEEHTDAFDDERRHF